MRPSFICLLLLGFLGLTKLQAQNPNYPQTALNFEAFKPYLGLNANSSDTLYVLNFWATWCRPCVAELPYFESLEQRFPQHKIKVLLVSLDFPEQLERQLLPFLKRKNIQSQVLLLDQKGVNDWLEIISPDWSGALPATLLYQGPKRAFYETSFDQTSLDACIENFLAQP